MIKDQRAKVRATRWRYASSQQSFKVAYALVSFKDCISGADAMHGEPLLLEFSGRVEGRAYICSIGGATVRFTGAELEAFVDLLYARLTSMSGLSRLPSIDQHNKNLKYVTVHRLRQTIDRALGAGAGRRLIVGGSQAMYALNVAEPHITVGPQVRELAPYHLPEETVARLLHAATRFVSET